MNTIFDQLGGLTVVRKLANEFYTVMEEDSNVKALRDIHPTKLISARKNLYKFLSEWFGGPKLFGAQHVNVTWLELRHRHFSLAQEHVDQWLYCMNTAMTNLAIDETLKAVLNKKFCDMIQAMRTQREKTVAS